MALHRRFWSGTFLVSGMSIGVGMLALPVVTAEGGFGPALLSYLLCWAFMFTTGLLVLEGCLRLPVGSNFITLTRTYLGAPGSTVCWLFYLFLFTCLMIAHTAAGGSAFQQITDWPLPVSTLSYLVIFAPFVLLGARWVARANATLIAAVFGLYLLFVFTAAPHVALAPLNRSDWSLFWQALPIIVTAFGFQNIVPTLTDYLERDRRLIRRSLLIGTLVPLVIYIVWELLILGIVPLPALQTAASLGQNGVVPLADTLHSSSVPEIGIAFALFAMTTSYLCIAIAFVDFLADGLHLAKKGRGLIQIGFIVFVLPFLIVLVDPTLFFKALGLAGGIGAMVLFGILPVLIAWRGHFRLPGGRATLGLLLAFALLVLGIEIL